MSNWIPYLKDPLVLIGFVVFCSLRFCKYLIAKKVIGPLPSKYASHALNRIITSGFITAIMIILLGFGLKYREISAAEQEQALLLLCEELRSNKLVVGALAENTQRLGELFLAISQNALRPESPVILQTLFPEDNLKLDIDSSPSPLDLSQQAWKAASESGLLESKRAELNAVRAAILRTLGNIRHVVASLGDIDGTRYVVRREVLDAHLPMLRKLRVVDASAIQAEYRVLEQVRTDYAVVYDNAASYVAAVENALDEELTAGSIASVLSVERLAGILIGKYGESLATSIKSLNASSSVCATRRRPDRKAGN